MPPLPIRDPAAVKIYLGDDRAETTGLYPALTEVVVETGRLTPSVATLTLASSRDEQGSWPVQDQGLLAPWQPILIRARFGSYEEEVMRGLIRSISADYPENAGESRVTVQCIDESLKMDREQVRREWGADSPTGDMAILNDIASRHDLSVSPESSPGQTGLTLLQNTTDNRFLRERAAANGFEFFITQGEIYFGPMRLDGEPQATIFVYAGPDTCCRRMMLSDNGHLPDGVGLEFPDPDRAAVVSETVMPDLPLLGDTPAQSTNAGLAPFIWKMDREAGTSLEELRARARGKANENAMKIEGQGELDGSRYGHVLVPGRTVQVDGLGERYGGAYYVDRVTHHFSPGGYSQEFVLLKNAYGSTLVHTQSPLGALI
ncbi:MAG: hypothetical protein HUN04_16555 [Desulfobacter sp.]|nr:MAG: hypothetical protein HUN04_16555 [Desulfobacter sp.]